MTLEEKCSARMKRKEKIKEKAKIGKSLEADRSALAERKEDVPPKIELTQGLSDIGGSLDHAMSQVKTILRMSTKKTAK